MDTPLNVGILLFDNMTMLDGFGPLQVFAFVPQFRAFTFARELSPVLSDCGARLTPDYDFESCPPLDILVVPGGGDVLPQMLDPRTQSVLQRLGAGARYVTSVCSGALILAEAGLLDGYRATTHWAYLPQLRRYPAVTVESERVVVDGNRITGGGVTAGIDFALTLIANVVDTTTAQTVQLIIEYNPAPPFDCGSPQHAPPAVKAQVDVLVQPLLASLHAHLDAHPPQARS